MRNLPNVVIISRKSSPKQTTALGLRTVATYFRHANHRLS